MSYNPNVEHPNVSQNTTVHALMQALRARHLSIPETKRRMLSKLRRNGVPIPQMTEEDAQCAASYPNFSDHNKEQILEMVELFTGHSASGMAKIDGCHALHQMGVKTEEDAHIVSSYLAELNGMEGPLRENGLYGKKCRRSMVNGLSRRRDQKGRFCKRRSSKRRSSKRRSTKRRSTKRRSSKKRSAKRSVCK
jgi:hypothetical protein